MKPSAKLIALAFVALSSVAYSAPTPHEESITLIESKNKNLFVFRIDRSLKGADVVVYSAMGEMVTAQKLSSKKMIIDFNNVKFGTYAIVVKKDDVGQEFRYEKKLVLSQVIR